MLKSQFTVSMWVCLLVLSLEPAWSTTGIVVVDFTNGVDRNGVPVG
jgi:hypothetical protein